MVGSLVAASVFGLTAGTIAYAAAVFAVNFALSSIVTRMFGDNPESQQDMGVRQQVPPSAVNAIPIVYGDAYMGGTFVDAVLTENQKTMYYVLAISCISPNGQFTFDTADMYYGDRKIAFGTGADSTKVISLTDEAGNVNTKISGNLYINLYTSSASGVITSANGASAPSTVMGGSDIAVAQRWAASNRQMNGLAFAIVKLVYNRDADTTQLSPITFYVSHALNGTGVAKAGDVWYDYITSPIYGGAVDTAFVNSTSATALNTYGDQLITFTDSSGNPSTQPRYRINGVLDAGQSVLSNIDRIMSACDSWMTYNAALGQWSVVVNKAETAAYAFTDDNIVGEIRVSATDITSSINQVEARFPFKENRDQAAFVNIETPSGLLYPNEPVNKYSITYDLVNDSVQAHYLANRLLEQAREDLIVSFSTTYYGIQVDAGDVVSVTNADYGWSSKLFRVMKVNEASLPDGQLGARMELSEYNAQVYDNQDITQFTPVPNSGLASPTYFSSLAAPTVVGYPSATFPHFDVTVFVPVTGRVTFGNLFYTTSATPTSADWKLLANASTSNSQPVTNNTYYTFANQTLGAGTYYFAYLVGNEVSQSTLSTKSTAFVWSPVANSGPFVDISGFTGFTKNSAGTVITPSSSVLTAVTQNVTSPTYAWVITGATPTTGTASTITITPSLTATSVTASLTVNGSNLATPIVRTITMPIALDGSGGSAGLNSATVNLYNKNTSTTPPALFSGTFTYTFTSGVLSGGTLNGWSQTPPSIAAGEFLFISLATASATTETDTIPYTEFSTPQVISGTGKNGANTAIVSLYQKNTSTSTPPTSPSGTFTYTFSTAVLSGGTLNGWAQSAPSLAAGEYLWQTQATAFSVNATDTIAATEFSSAVVVGGSGTDGTDGATGPRNAQVYFYYDIGQATAPTAPTAGQVSYDFATQTASITKTNWSTTFNPSALSTTSSKNTYWAVLVVFQETTFGGAYTETISSVFTWQNLNGLVTFTNLANSVGSGGTTTTFIDGGAITADTLSVNRVKSNTSGTFNTVTFGLGTGTSIGGYLGGGAFTSSSLEYYGLLAANTGLGFGIGAGTTNKLNADIGAIAAVGYGNSSFSTFKNAAYLGTGVSGGTFQTGGAGNLQTVCTADIRLAYYTGGTSYAFYIVSGSAYPFTAGHDGLQLLSESIPEIGDLMVDSVLIAAPNINDSITQMTVTTSANQKGVIGVFAGICGNDFVPSSLGHYIESTQGTKTDFVMKPEYANIYDTYRPIGVNAIGEGKINVCGQNGDIAIGDFIVASDMAGKGMKQSDDVFYNYTIAKARETVTFSSPTEVKQIACIYMGGQNYYTIRHH